MTGVEKLPQKRNNKIRLRADDRAMAIICYVVVGLFSLLCFLPFWYVIVYSLEPYSLYLRQPELPWPAEISLTSYRLVLKYGLIWSGYVNTAFLVFVGTPLTMALTTSSGTPSLSILTKLNSAFELGVPL